MSLVALILASRCKPEAIS